MADKKKILLVEDHFDIRRLLALFLEGAGYDVVEAETGLAAIERANTTHPDLITMDLGLPDIGGDQVINQLKLDPSTKHNSGDRRHGVLRGCASCGERACRRCLRAFIQACSAPNS